MADDRSQSTDSSEDRPRTADVRPGTNPLFELAEKHGGLHPGMTSPDSTQVPLRADTGEPDQEAIDGSGAKDRDR